MCWWQGDIEAMARHYREALEIWQAVGDDAELANAYYNESFTYTVPDSGGSHRKLGDPGPDRPEPPDQGSRAVREGRRPGRRRQRALGARATTLLPQPSRARASRSSAQALDMFQRTSDQTMEAWALHMLGTGLLREATMSRQAKVHLAHADARLPGGRRHGRDHAGLRRPLGRGGRRGRFRPRGPACVAPRGTSRSRPARSSARSSRMRSKRRSGRASGRTCPTRTTSSGSAPRAPRMTLDHAVAYALKGCRTECGRPGTGVAWCRHGRAGIPPIVLTRRDARATRGAWAALTEPERIVEWFTEATPLGAVGDPTASISATAASSRAWSARRSRPAIRPYLGLDRRRPVAGDACDLVGRADCRAVAPGSR